jgi:predicted transposase/invertase (TIGR01784 family)
MRRKNDILLKSAFEEAFQELLFFFFKEAPDIFDLSRDFEFMDKELSELFPEIEKKGGSRFVDMLVKTHLKNGKEEWILVHIEIQDGAMKNFPERMFQYYYRILDRFGVKVAALAVFTGGKNQKRISQYQSDFLGTKITYAYNVYHILDHTEEQLMAMHNPFALVILAAQKALFSGKIPETELAEQRLTIARALIESKRYDIEKIRRFLFFLKTFIHIENPEINRNFDREIELLTGKEEVMGIIEAIKMLTLEEGIEKGILKGEQRKTYEIVENLLLNTTFDVSKIAALTGTTQDFVIMVQEDIRQ